MSNNRKQVISIIGSRKTPSWAFIALKKAAQFCRENDIYVRSGGAVGADTAAQAGALEHCIVYEPWPGFSGPGPHLKVVPPLTPELIALARKFHPAPHKLQGTVLKLMARNGCQVLGQNLDNPTKGILFYAPEENGVVQGGTGQAIRIAKHYGIPTFNLFKKEEFWTLSSLCETFILESVGL